MVAQLAHPATSYRLILASRSPRRRELLAEVGVDAEAIDPGLDDGELEPGRVSPTAWVASLAYLKARSGLETRVWAEPVVVLGADTVCVASGPDGGPDGEGDGAELLGQPANEAEARRMLRALAGTSHEVLTGVALVASHGASRDVFVDRSVVRMPALEAGELDRYIASGQWRGKAGGYNIADRLKAGWAIEFQGDATSIMGLPMRALTPRLEAMAIARGGRRR